MINAFGFPFLRLRFLVFDLWGIDASFVHPHHVAYVVLHVLFGALKITHFLEFLPLRHIADQIDTQLNMT